MARTAVRLALLVGLSAAALVAALTSVAMVVLSWTQEDTRQAFLADTVRIEDSDDLLPGSWMWMRSRHGVEQTTGMPAGFPLVDVLDTVAATKIPDVREVSFDGHDYLVRTEERLDWLKQVATDLAPDRQRRERVVLALLFSGALGLLLAALGGAWLGRRAVRPMAESLALQRRFVADASHELRTPVTLLSTRAQMVRRSLRNGEPAVVDAGELDALIEDTNQLTAILEDLLLAADHRTQTQRLPVDLVAICRQVTDSAAPEAETRGVTIAPVEGTCPQVIGSPPALRRVVTALVDNAVRHARSEVRVSVGTARRRVYVDVSDDGGGIDPVIMPHLFDRFASGADGRTSGGDRRRYGLGLALVSEVAARHGGSVTAVEATGSGTRSGSETGSGSGAASESGAGSGAGSGATLRLTLPLGTDEHRRP